MNKMIKIILLFVALAVIFSLAQEIINLQGSSEKKCHNGSYVNSDGDTLCIFLEKDSSQSSFKLPSNNQAQGAKKQPINNSYNNCPNGSYVNSKGNTVCSPSKSNVGGATAICKDGTYSYSQSRRGTCSRHGGVAQWL